MMPDNDTRYTLKPADKAGFWLCTDMMTCVQLMFADKHLNDCQEAILPTGALALTEEEMAQLPATMREMGAWLMTHHADKCAPSLQSLREDFGAGIRAARKARRLTLTDLSVLSGVPVPNISRIESGLCSAGVDTLNRLALALGKRLALLDD